MFKWTWSSTLIVLFLYQQIHGCSVTLKWNEDAGQFFIKGFGPEKAAQPSLMLGNEGSFVKFVNPESHSEWVLHQFRIKDSPKKYTLRVEVEASSSIGSNYRIGITTNGVPSNTMYREWMAGSDGMWYAAGQCESVDVESLSSLWGSSSMDGWDPQDSSVLVTVDLESHLLTYFSEKDSSFMQLSIDGFTPIIRTGDSLGAVIDTVFNDNILTLNGVKYDFEPANFGPSLPNTRVLLGNMIFPEPVHGCEPFATRMDNKIAYIQRGKCDFVEKILNCQKAGAIMVIVGQGEPLLDDNSKRRKDLDEYLITMDASERLDMAAMVRIPAVFISHRSHLQIASLRNSRIQVLARASLSHPSHCGLHWKEAGITPGIWVSPGGAYRISREPLREPPVLSPKDSDTCRALAFSPIEENERMAWLSLLKSQRAKGGLLPSHRLVVNGRVCLESTPKRFTYWSLGHRVSLPWNEDKAHFDLIPPHVREGWILMPPPPLEWPDSGNTTVPYCRNQGAIASWKDAFKTHSIRVGEQTGESHATCFFMYSCKLDNVLQIVPAHAQLGCSYRAHLRYYWQVSADVKLAAVGVVAVPEYTVGGIMWGLRSDGVPYVHGKPIVLEPTARTTLKALEWQTHVGILLDLIEGRVYFITDASFETWLSITLDESSLNSLWVLSHEGASSPRGGYTPYAVLKSGSHLEISNLYSHEHANKVHEQLQGLMSTKTCVEVHEDATLCA